eukprot:3829842-Ditylum_brightwellii.AAC.1
MKKSDEYNSMTHSTCTTIGTAPKVWASRDQTTFTNPNAYIMVSLQNHQGVLFIIEMMKL